MSKRKKRKSNRRSARPRSDRYAIPRGLAEGLQEAEQLTRRKHWAQARDVLENLSRRYTGRPEVLTELVNIYAELKDPAGYQSAAQRLVKEEPDNPEATYGLAGSYLGTMRPALALRTYRDFVECWPDHEYTTDARQAIARLEEALPELMADLEVTDDKADLELVLRHEEMQVYLAQQDFARVRRTAQSILRQRPNFAPALNNLSLAYWVEGRLDRAIESAEQVLSYAPDNIHALSNLIHFLCLTGQTEEARAYGERLRASTAPASDKRLKQMEAFTFLGDDETVLATFDQAAGTDEGEGALASPMLYHLAAVAAARLGRETEARRSWRRALRIQQGLDVARENLDDLKHPLGERHGPWPFPLTSWLSPQALADLSSSAESAAKSERASQAALRRFLKKRPEVATTVPALLERGDPHGRELAVMLIGAARTPKLLKALKTFATGTNGPDQMRIGAAQLLREEGVLPGGETRLYIKGEWQTLMLLGFEVGDESEEQESYPPRVERLAEQATLALQDNDAQQAEALLNQALAIVPGSPGLLNNLAVAYQLQGRAEEAEQMIRQIHERHPSYMFARISVAQMAIRDGELERARELLLPLLQRQKLHYSEFDNLCAAMIDLYLAEDTSEGARSWLQVWESADPENPKLLPYRLRVGTLGRMPRRRPRRNK
jgi:tetratricopeptide (TPR) repeat protein